MDKLQKFITTVAVAVIFIVVETVRCNIQVQSTDVATIARTCATGLFYRVVSYLVCLAIAAVLVNRALAMKEEARDARDRALVEETYTHALKFLASIHHNVHSKQAQEQHRFQEPLNKASNSSNHLDHTWIPVEVVKAQLLDIENLCKAIHSDSVPFNYYSGSIFARILYIVGIVVEWLLGRINQLLSDWQNDPKDEFCDTTEHNPHTLNKRCNKVWNLVVDRVESDSRVGVATDIYCGRKATYWKWGWDDL